VNPKLLTCCAGFTFQRNDVARAFYAKHGFVEMAFGISPAPESEPDVEWRWAIS
jgi:hypothetical protein